MVDTYLLLFIGVVLLGAQNSWVDLPVQIASLHDSSKIDILDSIQNRVVERLEP
jgi:hypothetical protein